MNFSKNQRVQENEKRCVAARRTIDLKENDELRIIFDVQTRLD